MNFEEFKKKLSGQKIAVIGFGVSNKPLIKYLVKLNCKVVVFDKRKEEMIEGINEYKSLNVDFKLGEGYLEDISGFYMIFRSPSLLTTNSLLLEQEKKGTIISSEMDEFLKYCKGTVYGITGSDGKTTTSSLTGELLKAEGYKVWVGGNIGMPLFDKLEKIGVEDKVVLELSSFQLMSIKDSPRKAVITNLSENHLDIHKDMQEYIDSKKAIYLNQKEEDVLVLNKDNVLLMKEAKNIKGKVKYFTRKEILDKGAYATEDYIYLNGKRVCEIKNMKICGVHNVENFMAAILLVEDDVEIKTMKNIAYLFGGVEHRCELIKSIDGVKYYNDSIASSPTRTLATIKSFNVPLTVIAGGYDKKLSFEILAKDGFDNIQRLILIGDTKEKIKFEFEKEMKIREKEKEIIIVESLEEAVQTSKEICKEGEIVILSPACASFDMFKNFEDRGNQFKNLVKKL